MHVDKTFSPLTPFFVLMKPFGLQSSWKPPQGGFFFGSGAASCCAEMTQPSRYESHGGLMGTQEVKCKALFLTPLLLSLTDGYLLLAPAALRTVLWEKNDTNACGGSHRRV